MMPTMASVCRLAIHPIKGLDPVVVHEARVLASGALDLDRRWAFIDGAGRFLNGKNRTNLHELRADYDLSLVEVSLLGRTFSLEREQRKLALWVCEHLGETVDLVENTELGFPDDTASPGPTVVSSASLACVAEWFGLPFEQTRARFRTNVEVDGVALFWEDARYGSSFRIGPVTVQAVNPCQRCVVPTRDPGTGAALRGFQKRFATLRERTLPAAAKAELFNHYYRFAMNTRIAAAETGKVIRTGDEVRV